MKLRLSDTRSHAEEFHAHSQSEFSLGLYEALQLYRAHFVGRAVQRPHLHVWTDAVESQGRWIDAGYGRGTYIMLDVDMMRNTAYLAETWESCQRAAANAIEFKKLMGGMDEFISGEVSDDPR